MEKIKRVQEFIIQNNIDAVMVTAPANVFYFTKLSCDPHERLLALIIQTNKVNMLVPALEYENAKRSVSKEINIVSYLDTEDGYAKLQKFTGNISKLAIEKEHLTVSRYERIVKTFDIKEVFSVDEYIIDKRKYKTKDEIENLKIAASFADKAIEIAKCNMKEGITELELKAIIDFEMKKYVSSMSFDTMVLFGKNAADPHGESGDTKLKYGDYALFDLGVYYNGYASDETRTIAFGEVNDEAKKIYNIVKRANEEAIKACKPGVKFSQIDKIARDIITQEGYGEYFTHRLGHGLGIDVHEFPDVSSKTDDVLEENMVFTIEPGIYKPGVAGVRIEDDILITKDSYEVLTKYEK